MNVDCQWVGKNLEAFCCDNLDAEESELARAHIEACAACHKEVRALNAIDPLIKKYYQGELERARRPRPVNTRRVFGLSSVAAAFVAILLFVVLRGPQSSPLPSAPAQPQIAPTASVELPAPVKNDAAGEVARAKPSNEPDTTPDRKPQAPPAVSEIGPDFLVTDPAGYSHTLNDYRGHVVVIGMWGGNQPEPTANLERLYKTFGANPKFRFLGVANERLTKPSNTTFPVVYNQGSKVFGIQPGQFVLLDETGLIERRGSLLKDFESLRKALQGK